MTPCHWRATPDLGNVQAAEKGPVSYGKRVVRRRVYRKSNTVLGQVTRVYEILILVSAIRFRVFCEDVAPNIVEVRRWSPA